jgi:hypothetical protein
VRKYRRGREGKDAGKGKMQGRERCREGKDAGKGKMRRLFQARFFNASGLLNWAILFLRVNSFTHAGFVFPYSLGIHPMAFWTKNSCDPDKCTIYSPSKRVSGFCLYDF